MTLAEQLIIAGASLGFVGCTVGALLASHRLTNEAVREAKPVPYNGPMTDGPVRFGMAVFGCVIIWFLWVMFF